MALFLSPGAILALASLNSLSGFDQIHERCVDGSPINVVASLFCHRAKAFLRTYAATHLFQKKISERIGRSNPNGPESLVFLFKQLLQESNSPIKLLQARAQLVALHSSGTNPLSQVGANVLQLDIRLFENLEHCLDILHSEHYGKGTHPLNVECSGGDQTDLTQWPISHLRMAYLGQYRAYVSF